MEDFLNEKVPFNKNIEISLTSVYGIGRSESIKICKKLGFNPKASFADLSNNYKTRLANYITFNYVHGFYLKRSKKQQIDFIIKLRSYRGTRHFLGYLVRGQRSKNKKGIKSRFKKNIG